MRKYLPHILIISFVFLLAPTAHVVSLVVLHYYLLIFKKGIIA